MIKINFPEPSFKIKEENNAVTIWDHYRKKWVRLTPEEWVRQNFIAYLVQEKNYPAEIIAVEKTIQIGELKKRFDIVVYKDAKPWMIVECKEPNVPLSLHVLDQLHRYNMVLTGKFLVITNGHYTKAWQGMNNQFSELEVLPDWYSSV